MAPSPTIRRLLRECAELSSESNNPSPAFYAAPVSDADLHEWHFTLLGPPSPSPYAGGLYHGRITLPTTYPLKPPNFRFLTPSGRFEVNREICLSISGFHEETWMPAWGIRTALTALRTFMAEPGTAGQVGGLEAPEEVRKRLAKESKSWRCDGCGKTTDTIMKDWWQMCEQKGIKVDEEGEINLETLPVGMNVEARTPGSAKGKEPVRDNAPAATSSPMAQQESASQPGADSAFSGIVIPREPIKPSTPPPQQRSRTESSTSRPSDLYLNVARSLHTPSSEAVQARAEARLTTSDLHDPVTGSPISRQTSRSLLEAHSAPLSESLATRNQQLQPTLTIDRAIAGVLFALCLMVLKKIFYPASGRDLGDFYLEREI